MNTDKKECTVKELCEFYGVTNVTVGRWMKKKNLPFIKRGRNVFFEIDKVEEWIKEYYGTTKYNYIDHKNEKAVN